MVLKIIGASLMCAGLWAQIVTPPPYGTPGSGPGSGACTSAGVAGTVQTAGSTAGSCTGADGNPFALIGPPQASFPAALFGDTLPAVGQSPFFVGAFTDGNAFDAVTILAVNGTDPAGTYTFGSVTGAYNNLSLGNAFGISVVAYYDGGVGVTGNDIEGVQASCVLLSGSISPYTACVDIVTFNHGVGDIAEAWDIIIRAPVVDGGGTITSAMGLYEVDRANAAIANNYYSWFDSRGVRRVKEDSTFDSVGQAIEALYNPQFTKYTPGAVDYERIILGEWNGNIAELGAQAGGTGVLRETRIIGKDVQIPSLAFASLGTPANSAEVYCVGCAPTSAINDTCVADASDSWAQRINGAWTCKR